MARTTVNTGPDLVKRFDIEARQDLAFTRRMQGVSFRALAAELGVSLGQAYNDFHSGLDRYQHEHSQTLDELVRMEAARYDEWMGALVPFMGSPQHTMAFVAVSKARRELLGLDAPKRMEVSGRGGGPIQHDVSQRQDSLDDAFNRISDPAERAAYIERIRAADEACRVAETALGDLAVPGDASPA